MGTFVSCPVCREKYIDKDSVYNHLNKKHSDIIPKNMSESHYYFYKKTGKKEGRCVECKKSTTWNENTKKYNRYCGDKCLQKYVQKAKNRMIGKYGSPHILNDPEQQRKMAMNRKISGTYKWSDNINEIPYMGSYELDFLKMCDLVFNISPKDIISPSPHTYYYEYDKGEKFYIPDMYICSLNLEIEIKDGGDNPNNHHKIQNIDKNKEKLKDEVMLSQNVNYVKIYNKDYSNFIKIILLIKDSEDDNKKFKIINDK